MTQRILLIDDDVELAELLSEYLISESFEVDCLTDGPSAVRRIRENPDHWDAIILDVMMPGMNGFDVLKSIRPLSLTPVLMLTARGEDTDTVLGLELGADDYVAKPVSPRVLVARIRALLRRGQTDDPGLLKVGDITLDESARRITLRDQVIKLTGAEFNLLALLLRHAGQVVTRETLAAEGLGRPLTAYDRRIETHMAQIRRKLGPLPDGSPRIQTLRGTGYQYVIPHS